MAMITDPRLAADQAASTTTTQGCEGSALYQAAYSALRFAGSRNAISTEHEKAILALVAASPRLTTPAVASAEVRDGHAMQFECLLDDVPDTWRQHGYKSEAEEIADMANVGRALMAALPEGYSYNDCPSEIVSDLQNERDDALAALPPTETPDEAGRDWRDRTHANTHDEAMAMFEHLNCPHCGGSGHIDDTDDAGRAGVEA